MNRLYAVTVVCILILCADAWGQSQKRYEPTWESLDSRPLPQWYDDAKLGIKIHWGVFSVPSWAPTAENLEKGTNKNFAEWYWYNMSDPDGPQRKHHDSMYGPDFRYQDFAPLFTAELWDPDEWAELVKRSGAGYVILTSKHHEGFCLWPNRESWNWNSVDIGPHRDIAGELTAAVRKRGLKMGFYYSFYEWFNPLYNSDVDRYVDEHMLPQLYDLVTRYEPDLVYGDGAWDHPSDVWKTKEFLTWLFNESPVRDHVMINDRWGSETRSRHGGYYLSEYFKYTGENAKLGPEHKWAETRSIGASFGFNRNENYDDYQTSEELIHLFINVVARGGNLCLNIGPASDGTVPVIMQERLIDIGDWLWVNGEAIYKSKVWRVTEDGDAVRYTTRDGAVYAIVLDWPEDGVLRLGAPQSSDGTAITMLGWSGDVSWRQSGSIMEIDMPSLAPDKLPCRYAWVFKLSGVK